MGWRGSWPVMTTDVPAASSAASWWTIQVLLGPRLQDDTSTRSIGAISFSACPAPVPNEVKSMDMKVTSIMTSAPALVGPSAPQPALHLSDEVESRVEDVLIHVWAPSVSLHLTTMHTALNDLQREAGVGHAKP